jgi:hypothetical protein
MNPLTVAFMLIAAVLSVMTFRRAMDMGWGLVTALLLAAVPLVATYFLNVMGLFASATLVGGLYKAGG